MIRLKPPVQNRQNHPTPHMTKNVTVQDVARRAEVSKTTAASVLRAAPGFQVSEATRRRVLSSAQELGYRRHAVATALSSGRTHTIGLILPLLEGAEESISRIYWQDIFTAVFQAANRADLHVTAIPLSHIPDPQLRLQHVTDRLVDGVIMASLRDPQFVRCIYDAGIHCVEIGSGYGKHLIHPDNEAGAEVAVAHLVELGHRRIAHWAGHDSNYAAVHRRTGFLSAVTRHGLCPDQTPVISNQEEVARVLRSPDSSRPTALFAYNDYQACLTLDVARDLGLRVPTDLSVIGFDDNILAEAARPQLTTIRNPLGAQADAAIDLLQALWSGETEPNALQTIPTRLTLRQSTAAPPSNKERWHYLNEVS